MTIESRRPEPTLHPAARAIGEIAIEEPMPYNFIDQRVTATLDPNGILEQMRVLIQLPAYKTGLMSGL